MPPSAPARADRRRALLGAAALLAVLGLLVWWLLPARDSAPHGRVAFSTGVPSGVYQRYGDLLKEALAQDLPGLTVTLRDSEGSQENLARVSEGGADFTIATADAVATYMLNSRPGAQRLRGCARLYDDYVQLVVPAGSRIRSVEDLRGRRVGVGQPGSGVRLVADRILTAAGLDLEKDVMPVSAGIDTVPDQLKEKKLDAFFWSGGLPTNAVQKLSERMDIRLVPLGGELVRRLHASGGTSLYYRSAAVPADAYPRAQQGQPVATIAVANLLVTTERTDPGLTEAFTRTVIDSRDRIGREVHSAQLVDLRTAIYTDPLPLHEGSRRYFRSAKP
ncbi:TAXI family TRAP transporter solute-binding subunit [Streptomyces sp. LP05-1]|uniref:TAXI family TRAP transporter solute-binding subunit n=1 Tax=Streptomyces pyxinae TaxID=2970734 RepID=A0ABT2CJP9_9ACTN|nr:TAXI family TRAP transporter solute-binding subunit [Streptomyces sp. LP05-1]MCS0637649.1 TAXI family TRAP transporter solute-binding subunit [Streptomyces sp. LP05-1]